MEARQKSCGVVTAHAAPRFIVHNQRSTVDSAGKVSPAPSHQRVQNAAHNYFPSADSRRGHTTNQDGGVVGGVVSGGGGGAARKLKS